MKTTPLISVIVPVYNVEKWLERCVESICMQTYQNLEIILVNDGSIDCSGTLCDEMSRKDKRIKVVHKTNGGLSDARNAGVECSSGEYISFIDSDDWVEPAFYEYLFQTMREEECDVVGCAYRKCVEGEKHVKVSVDFEVKNYNRENAMKALIENQIQQVVWNKLYKRSIIEGIVFEKGKYHEDEFWSYQIFGRMQKYAEISYVGYDYFQRTDSIMGEKYSLKRLDAVEAKVSRQKYLENVMPELKRVGKLNLTFTCMYHGQLALRQLDKQEQNTALEYLKKVIDSNRLEKAELVGVPLTHQMWMKLSQVSFVVTCRLRNICRVGM